MTTKEKILKLMYNRGGYAQVDLQRGGKDCRKMCRVHRLVADAFLSKIKGKNDVNHIDGNKRNNCVDNLEWMTRSENHLHAFKIKLRKPMKGERSGMSKLNDDKVRKIRELYKKGKSYVEIAGIITDISASTVRVVCNKESWTHVK